MSTPLRLGSVVAVVIACTLAVRATDNIGNDHALNLQLATRLYEDGRYRDALRAYERVIESPDADTSLRARKGRLRSAVRVAEFGLARRDADALQTLAPNDPEALTLQGDALWSAGLFDEADAAYQKALALAPGSSRARYGAARSLATHGRVEEAVKEALAAAAAAPRDAEIYAAMGEMYERLNRFDRAADAFTNYINLLPKTDRSDNAQWSRSHLTFLQAFNGRTPAEMDPEDATTLHTLPFRLMNANKVVVRARVNGSSAQDFVLDTGSEETVISRDTAQRERVRPITQTFSAGVGEVGVRGLQLARLDSLELGTLEVRNLPVLIKDRALRNLPQPEAESFSPLSLGMSMTIDYQRRLLTIGRNLPQGSPDFRLPMRIHRLAMVRGVLNSTFPAYFVVDTGGEVISISSDTASVLPPRIGPPIRLKVYGTSGWDKDAFLMPGVDLNFDKIEYRNTPLVVLNLKAPSSLLGFQLGGIIGHKFLGGYRVTMDIEKSELRLEKF